jgi:adenine phosphoribosyltransferase
MLDKLKLCLKESPIIKKGSYDYFVSPITDGIPCMDPQVLQEIIDRILEVANLDCDYIVAPEAMGIPIAVPLSLRTSIPYNLVRKKKYGLPGEVTVCQETGYSRSEMYINGLKRGDRVVLVDDVVSTGGTLKGIVQALQRMGVNIVDIVVVLEKGPKKAEIERELGVRIKTLVRVEVKNGRLVVLD